MEKVQIDDKTRQYIQSLIGKINATTATVQLIVDTYINAKELEGTYTLSPDGAFLTKQEGPDA